MKKAAIFLAMAVLVGGLVAGYARAQGLLFPDEEKSPLNLEQEKKEEKPRALQEQAEEVVKKEAVKEVSKYWTCTMHPSVKSDKPGECPICGMNLIQVEKKEEEKDILLEYNKQEEVRKFKDLGKKILPWAKRKEVKKEEKDILLEYNEQVEREDKQKITQPYLFQIVPPEKVEEQKEVPAYQPGTIGEEKMVESELIDVQKKIALTNKKNELEKLNLEASKIALEQKKVMEEFTKPVTSGIQEETEKKQKTEGMPFLLPPPEIRDLSVLMISSSKEGARALVREGNKTFYVQVGSKIQRGEVIAITPEGIRVQEGEFVKFYPISSP